MGNLCFKGESGSSKESSKSAPDSGLITVVEAKGPFMGVKTSSRPGTPTQDLSASDTGKDGLMLQHHDDTGTDYNGLIKAAAESAGVAGLNELQQQEPEQAAPFLPGTSPPAPVP